MPVFTPCTGKDCMQRRTCAATKPGSMGTMPSTFPGTSFTTQVTAVSG